MEFLKDLYDTTIKVLKVPLDIKYILYQTYHFIFLIKKLHMSTAYLLGIF